MKTILPRVAALEKIIAAGLVSALVMAGQSACAQTDAGRVVDDGFLNSLRAEVRTNHPTLAAAEARLAAADAGVRAVRLWDDPVVGAGVMAAETMMRKDEGDLMFSAEQALPRRKLYEARRAKAAAERGVTRAEWNSAALQLETLVAQTALELALADEVVALSTQQVAWVESIAINARQRLADPSGSAAEPLRVESELALEQQRLDTHQRQRMRLARELNILLGRALDAPWAPLRLPERPAPVSAVETELQRLLEANPLVQAQLRAAEAAHREIEVAQRERTPMFSVGVDSRVYSGGDFREATVGAKMTLPWFNRSTYKATVDQARQQQAAAEREVEALERELRREAVAAQTDAETAGRQAATFAGQVIPRAEKATEAVQAAWISARASLLEVLEARRTLLNARLEERRALAAQRAALETLRSIIPPTQNSHP